MSATVVAGEKFVAAAVAVAEAAGFGVVVDFGHVPVTELLTVAAVGR